MTRANPGKIYQLDPELERSLRKARKRLQFKCSTERTPSTSEATTETTNFSPPFTNISFDLSSNPYPNIMEERTIRQLATSNNPIINNNIQYPKELCELKTDLLKALPQFHGLSGENPHKHLRQFHMICENFISPTIALETLKMIAFPFTLQGATQDWWLMKDYLVSF